MLTIKQGRCQAIITKYHAQTNTRGARISAQTESGVKVSIPYPHDLNHDDRHECAVRALCDKMGWTGTLVSGGLAKGNHVYVFVPEES